MLIVNIADEIIAHSAMAQVQAYAEQLRRQHQELIDACTPIASRIAKPSYYGPEDTPEPDAIPTVRDQVFDFDFDFSPPAKRRIGY